MTDSSIGRAVLTVLAVVLAIPLFMMVVVMPVLGLAGAGHGAGGPGGLKLLLPLIPLTAVSGVAYFLYTRGSDENGRPTDGALAELRAAYARGDLSGAEFETRRNRLRSDTGDEEVSNGE